uniref:Ig-like domain-containing protein n=1 Tax=Maylandia zebra TaxID=106582 RepID=A0A3P9ARW1_9CICH
SWQVLIVCLFSLQTQVEGVEHFYVTAGERRVSTKGEKELTHRGLLHFSSVDIHWYKQSLGDTLKIIWTLKESATPRFAPEFDNSRWEADYDKNVSNLTILRTNQEDEGIYHCGFTEWLQDTTWTGTYLLVKGDSVTLQCSVLSSSVNKTCPGGLEVFWFKEGSHRSHPSIIYTNGNGHHECEKRSETEKSCAYRFSKNISSSDAGTYYCAVATCGEILYGKGTKLDIQGTITSVQLGETVTIPCQLPVIETIRKEVHWYKQRAGDTLKVIWTMRESATPEFAPEFNNSRLKVNHNKHFTNLTILKTNQEDEGIYHCGFTEWRKNTEWTGTYLLVKGNDVRFFHGVLPHASVCKIVQHNL